jgi:hypothetical protein
VENEATRPAGFASDREQSDNEVIWDDAEEDEGVSSNVAAEDSSATHGDDGEEEPEELKGSGELLSHSSKFSCPSSLRDLSVEWIPGYPGSPATGPRHRPIFSPRKDQQPKIRRRPSRGGAS